MVQASAIKEPPVGLTIVSYQRHVNNIFKFPALSGCSLMYKFAVRRSQRRTIVMLAKKKKNTPYSLDLGRTNVA